MSTISTVVVKKSSKSKLATQGDSNQLPKSNTSGNNAIQSRDQLRAKHALEQIEQLKQIGKITDREIKSAVAGLPAMIHMNGLGHAFAFYLGDPKGFPARLAVVNAVFDWLNNHSGVYTSLQHLDIITPLLAITQSDLQTHQIAQQESQAYMLWLKKFARALLTDSDLNTSSDH